MDLQKVIEVFEELGYDERAAKRKLIHLVSDRKKLEELIAAFEAEGDFRYSDEARMRYRRMYGWKEGEDLPGDPLYTDKGVRITAKTIVSEHIDFLEFISAVNRKGFCLQFGCTTCGNMELRNVLRRLGRDAIIQLMLNTEPEGMLMQFRDSIYIWTIELLFPGAFAEFKMMKEAEKTAEKETEVPVQEDELPW